MPRVAKGKPNADAVYVAWQSFAAQVDGNPVSVRAGERLLSDSPVVVACFWNFVRDGADAAEMRAKRNETYPDDAAHHAAAHYTPPPLPVRDKDAAP